MYVDASKADVLATCIRSLPRGPDDQVMVLLPEAHQDQVEPLIRLLNEAGISFFGAVFPGLIHGAERQQTGAIIKRLPCLGPPALAQLTATGVHWLTPLPTLPSSAAHPLSAYVFVDCLAPNISRFLNGLFNRYSNTLHYQGAGAGNSHLHPNPAIFTPLGFFPQAAVVAIVSQRSTVRVRHGWQRLQGPFVATRTHHNVLEELNWEPALVVYQATLAQEIPVITHENFFTDVTPHFPFSIYKESQEDVVCDPVGLTDDKGIVFLADVPENAVMYIMRGEPLALIEAAGQAVDDCLRTADLATIHDCLACDCFSRMNMLAKAGYLSQELQTLADKVATLPGGIKLEGVVALGEIASDGEHAIDLHNQTFVIGMLHD